MDGHLGRSRLAHALKSLPAVVMVATLAVVVPTPAGAQSAVGSLEVTNVVDWNGVRSQVRSFEICITGPSYPDGNEAGACQTTDQNGGVLTWNDLDTGAYAVAETALTAPAVPDSPWTSVVASSPATVTADATTPVTVTNTHSAAAGIYMSKSVPLDEGDPDTPGQTFDLRYTNAERNIGVRTLPGSGLLGRNDLSEGTWLMQEPSGLMPDDWYLIDIVCTSRDGTSTFDTFEYGETGLDIYLAAGDRVQCELTNVYDPPPELVSVAPVDGAIDVDPGTDLTMVFDRAIVGGDGAIEVRRSSDSALIEAVNGLDGQVSTTTVADDTISFDLDNDLADLTGYTVVVEASSVAAADNSLNVFPGVPGPSTWTFTTSDTTAPTVTSVAPTDNATIVDPATELHVVFDEPVQTGSGTIELRAASDDSLVESFDITTDVATSTTNASNDTLSMALAAPLAYDTEYYVLIEVGVVTDSSLNAFAGISDTGEWSFTTIGPPPTVTIGAAAGQASPTNDTRIDFTVVFDQPVDGFGAVDVTLAGSAGPTDAVVTPVSDTNYTVTVTGMTSTGTVAASVVADAALNGDQQGNPASDPATVFYDITPPVLSLPVDITVPADPGQPGATVDFLTSTAAAELAAEPVMTCAPASGSFFPIGETRVECSSADEVGNEATGSFLVTVTDDENPIVIDIDDQEFEVNGSSGPVEYDEPSASDNSGAVEVTCDPPSGSTFDVGTTTVTCTAVDGAGNTSVTTFDVVVASLAVVTTPSTTTPSVAPTTVATVLPVTGSDTSATMWTGIAALLGGAALLVLATRRRMQPTH